MPNHPRTKIPETWTPEEEQAYREFLEACKTFPKEGLLTREELDQARQAALDYYAGTVFDVTELVFEEQMANTASFTIKCSKGGVTVDPARSIVLELQDGAWTVVNEGY